MSLPGRTPSTPRARTPLRLHQRLSLLLALCAGATALFGLIAVAATGLWLQPARSQQEAGELARTLANALEAPLAFDDPQAAKEALAVLRARTDIQAAAVFDSQGRVVANYALAGDAAATAVTAAPSAATEMRPGPTIADARRSPFSGVLVVSESIGSGAQALGRVEVVKSLHDVYRALALQLGAILLGSAAGLALALATARRIARRIVDPITELADTSTAIAEGKDYSQRLRGGGDDEIGHAVLAFNRMLEELQGRGDALELAMQTLERRVADRTAELQRERDRAEAASTAKTRFLANMSHELRTPLNAVIGAAQLLQQSDAEGEQPHLVEVVRHSGVNLLGLIENVLDISRIESGALELSFEDFNLVDCLEATLATAAVAARAKGLALAGVIDPALPVWRHGDAMRLRQVVLNLLGNAIKFTAAGDVVLRADCGSAPDTLRLSVQDSGIGIDLVQAHDIFEPFRQADDTTTRRFGGTGLGLAISRQLVRAMGGDIAVTSAPGAGSTFGFEVRLAPPATAVALASPLPQQVVYFEPHEASAEALAALLARCGCDAERVDGADALRAWFEVRRAQVLRRPPWLLVSTDARKAASVLREARRWLDAERIVGLHHRETTLGDPVYADFDLPRGMIKPVLRAALVSRLGSADDAGSTHRSEALAGDSDGEAGLVLVVEDDLTNQMIVGSMLRNAGYEVITANDGRHALAMLHDHDVDLVLMDWQMPDMDGLAVTRLVRAGAAGARGQRLPIVALTANAFAEDRAACLAAGMNDFLTKPVLSSQLLAVVRRWILQPEGSRFGPLSQPALLL